MKTGKVKNISVIAGLVLASFSFCSIATGADKVVVIPLNTGGDGGKFVDGDNSADAVYTNGKVGIGTANPQAVLHVGGTPGVDGIMFPDGTLQTSATLQGPKGDKGDTGATGPQGHRATGPQGLRALPARLVRLKVSVLVMK